jgi:hypothetical protein
MLLLSATKLVSTTMLLLLSAAAPNQEAWKGAYREHLTTANPAYAALFDIDGDGTPELLSDNSVYALESGKAQKKVELGSPITTSIALPADSKEKGLYILTDTYELDGTKTSVSKLDASFKLTDAGLIERDCTFRDYNTEKVFTEKRVINGKELSKSDPSPWGEPLNFRAITFSSQEASGHSITSLLDSYPAKGGNPTFSFNVSGGYGEPGRGTYVDYFQNRLDFFPFQNLNISNLPDTWLLMLDGSLIPGANLRLSNGEPFLPLPLAIDKLGIDRAKLTPASIGGVDYVSAVSVSKLGFKVETQDLFKALE